MTTVLGEIRQPNPGHGPNDTNPLYPVILATAILCSILTTIFAAARLVTKRLTSKYDLEDCECRTTPPSTRQAVDLMIRSDFLMAAWVSTHSYSLYAYKEKVGQREIGS